jgi:hypothetical protein
MKINVNAHAAFVAAATLLAGCGSDHDLLAMKIELKALKQELEYVRDHTEDLEPRVQSTEQMALQAFDDRDAPAPLDCQHGSDRELRMRLAALTAFCDGAVAYAGGHRIRLSIGNATAARLDRLSLTLYAGANAARGRSSKRLHHEADVALPPGAWQSIEIDFDGIDAQDLRELAVRANLAAVALAGR